LPTKRSERAITATDLSGPPFSELIAKGWTKSTLPGLPSLMLSSWTSA
jgi:hypothetical protein